MSSESKKVRKTVGAPKRSSDALLERTTEPAVEVATAHETTEDAECDAKKAKKAALERLMARGTAPAPVNVVDSASMDEHGFPSLLARVHGAKVDQRDSSKVNLDLIGPRIVAPGNSVIATGGYLHAIYTQKPAVDSSAPPKTKTTGMTEKYTRILNESPLYVKVAGSHAYVSYTVKQGSTAPPPPVGALVRLLNVEPKRGTKPGTEREVYLNCTKGFVFVGAPPLPHRCISDYIANLQDDPRIADAITRDIFKAAGGAAQFVRPTGASTDAAMSAGEKGLVAYDRRREQERTDAATRIQQIADRLPPKELNRDTKADGLRAVAKRLTDEPEYELPTSDTARTVTNVVIVHRGGRGGGRFEDSSLVGAEQDQRVVNLFDDDLAAAVPTMFASMEFAYKPTIHGKLITAHFRCEAVLDKTTMVEGELGGDSTGIVKSVESTDTGVLTPVCGFKMTTAVAGASVGVFSKVHLEGLLKKHVQHIPFVALVKTGDRQPYAPHEPIDVDWVRGWITDMPKFLEQIGVRVSKEWTLKNVAGGRSNFRTMKLVTDGPAANALQTPPGQTRLSMETHACVNLLEADGAAPEDLEKAAYNGVAVRYCMVPLGAGADPAATLALGASEAEGEAYMTKLISESGKEPRAFFEEGLCLPYAVLVAV